MAQGTRKLTYWPMWAVTAVVGLPGWRVRSHGSGVQFEQQKGFEKVTCFCRCCQYCCWCTFITGFSANVVVPFKESMGDREADLLATVGGHSGHGSA